MKNNDWKDRLNIVYSTNPDFQYDNGEEEEVETLDKKQQKLRVSIEKKGRGGKDRNCYNRLYGQRRRLERTGQTAKDQMWCGRIGKGRGNPHSGRVSSAHHRFTESGRLYADQITFRISYFGISHHCQQDS